MGNASASFEIIDATLSDSDCRLSVCVLCDLAGVSRSGYYA